MNTVEQCEQNVKRLEIGRNALCELTHVDVVERFYYLLALDFAMSATPARFALSVDYAMNSLHTEASR